MKRLWRDLLIAGFLTTFVILLGTFNATKPRILVLHSATQESPWVTRMDAGMRDALQRNRRPIDVEWLYMGVTAPGDRDMREATAEAQRAIRRVDPDLVIAVDDEANALIARDYVGRDRPGILYVSIDRPPSAYGYPGEPNVTGIADALPWAAVRDVLSGIFGDRPTIAVLGVDSESGRAELDQLRAFDWGPVSVGQADLVSTAPAWRAAVARAAGADALVLLSTQSLPDGDGGQVPAAELSRWTQEWTQDNAGPLPIGTSVDFVADGGALSFSPPPDSYGEDAIDLALDWLDGRRTPGPPPPVSSAHFEVAMRQDLLAQRGVVLPPIYAEAARENGTLF
ncbi:MAG: hypothetical protein E6Q56_12555 [Mycobacterium sp.]|nr:MAG: hypothetical protein E6Q56_12555 [Mycobacterium sp.]